MAVSHSTTVAFHLERTHTMMDVNHRRRSVLVITHCVIIVFLYHLPIVYSWDVNKGNNRYHWRNDVSDSRHPGTCRCVFRHNNFKVPSGLRRQRNALPVTLLSRANKEDGDPELNNPSPHQSHRRHFLLSSATMLSTTIATSTLSPRAATARGLVHFPCVVALANVYHFMRVGTSLLEEQGILSTNPLFLTNREDALSPKGIEQVVETCRSIQLDEKRLPTLVKYSLAASCVDTAMIVGQELKLGTDRIVPEFTFLDPRGIGGWDMSSRDITLPALWAMDNDEAGTDGLYALPPSSDDGTPHEVLAEQAVRLRQILSILESQYSGDTILLIFPDGTGPALLSAMIAGIPYNRVHELEYSPGEIRFDVTMQSTLALWKEKQSVDAKAYNEIMKKGRVALKDLRATHERGGTVTNLKDKQIEEDRISVETEYRMQQQERIEAELQKETLRLNRQTDLIETQRRTDKLDMGTQTALGVAAIVGAGATTWYLSSNSTTAAATNESDTLHRHDNISNIGGGLYSTPLDFSLTQSDTSRDEVLLGQLTNNVVSKTFDPKERAKIAMDEYMNRDDGSEDWLVSIAQIINEESVDEEGAIVGNGPRKVNQTTIIDDEPILSLSDVEGTNSHQNDLLVQSLESSEQPFH